MDPFLSQAKELAGLVNRTLDDTLTVARTGATMPCRLQRDNALFPLPPVVGIDLPLWTVVTAIGADVQAGDTITVTGRGAYTVLRQDESHTYDIARNCVAVQTRKADGSWNLALTDTVSFRRGVSNPSTAVRLNNVSVNISPAIDTPAAAQQTGQTQYDWYVTADPNLMYPSPDNGPIRQGDVIEWSKARKGILLAARVVKPGYPFDRYIVYATEPQS